MNVFSNMNEIARLAGLEPVFDDNGEKLVKHTCPFCESTATVFDQVIKEYWCDDCLRWDDQGDDEEESLQEIHRIENAILDKS